MAKYKLMSNGRRFRTCNILDENLLADTYTVKFDNGVIKNVSRKKVYDLDHIDEAVLDRLKEFAESLWDNIVKKGKYIFMKIKGAIIPVNSPINTMVAAQTVDGVSFYPSEDLARLAEESGIEANIVKDEPDEEDEDQIEAVNAFWEDQIEQYKAENGIEDDEDDYIEESLSYKYRRPRLYEGRKSVRRPKLYEDSEGINAAGDSFAIESISWPNYSASEIIDLLLDQYDAFLKGNARRGVGSIPIPYCIWGAPGIGKTQIIKEVIEIIQEEEGNATIMSINAMSMRKDDFSFPVKVESERDVINSRGERVRYSDVRGGDVLKTWLPVYRPGDKDAAAKGITDDELDDIANGGDGTGTGRGGIIFFDELSRISPDVLNIIMTLVQDRKFNEYELGSKWMIVAAANPPQVLGAQGERMMWDPAQTDRFSHCFLKPSFQDWLVWARSPIKGTNRPHIHEDILTFLTQHPECWNNASMTNKEDKKDKVAKTKYPNPRGWESVSKERYNREDARMAEQDPTSFRARAAARRGMKPRPTKLSTDEMTDVLTSNVGKQAAQMYKRFYSFDGIFGTDLAEQVWTDGENTEIPFNVDNLILEKAINKIIDCHPDAAKPSGEITADEFANICTYIVRCVDTMDAYNGASKDVIMKQAVETLFGRIAGAPFEIIMNEEANKQKYKEGLNILANRTKQTRNNIRTMRSA